MIDLQKAFKVLDTNNDGMLSKNELTVGYQRIYGEAAQDVVERVFEKVDIDGSGQIDYSEWVVATINKKNLLTKEKL
jgi:calcium-dependent protein kinase